MNDAPQFAPGDKVTYKSSGREYVKYVVLQDGNSVLLSTQPPASGAPGLRHWRGAWFVRPVVGA